MCVVKMRPWEIALIKGVGIPLLKRLHKRVEESAKETETEADDYLADMFSGIITAVEMPDFFQET